MTAMLDHAGMIEAGEKTIADRDAEIETLKHKAHECVEFADKIAFIVKDLQVEFTGQVLQLEVMLARIQQKFEDHSHSLAGSMAGKEAEMATMRKLAEADQRQASLSGECWACD